MLKRGLAAGAVAARLCSATWVTAQFLSAMLQPATVVGGGGPTYLKQTPWRWVSGNSVQSPA